MYSRIAALAVFISALVLSGSALAADTGEYKSPGDFYSMEAHFVWCGTPKTAAGRLKRFEQFWAFQRPERSDGYDDSFHVRTVRRCAYRLAVLYAEVGRAKDCLKILKWLEQEDDTLNLKEGS